VSNKQYYKTNTIIRVQHYSLADFSKQQRKRLKVKTMQT